MFSDYHNPNDYWQHNPMKQDPNIDPDDAMKSGCFVCLFYLIAFAVCVLLCALFGSCTTTEYVTVEKIKHDTTYVSKVQRDSVWLHDSVFIKEWTAGDTVYRDRIQWHTKYVEKQVRDTIYQHRVDSVPQPYPYTIYVERKLSILQVVLMTIGCLALMALLVFIVVKLKRFLPYL